jgi:RNA polymerase sigma-70 factor (ECF subfamily)
MGDGSVVSESGAEEPERTNPRVDEPSGGQSPSPAWPAEVSALYARLGRELWALYYTQCSDPDRASDALQEAFLRLQQYQGAPIQDLRAWLLQVGRNWLRDVARRERVAARPAEHLDALAGGAAEPIASVLDDEVQGVVREALDRLRADDREVLVLRYALGWPSIRIADVLNSTAAAIDMRLSRARRRLAEILTELGLGHDTD